MVEPEHKGEGAYESGAMCGAQMSLAQYREPLHKGKGVAKLHCASKEGRVLFGQFQVALAARL